ncbi:MAG TPA: PAAR domain-containing protein [Candidatus Limnocylindrales bacterium]|nr:PAAR domain-containing protein [Candidatus Limnocylindrales bacterium]
MAQPLVMGDKIQGQCSIHQIPNPASGAPQPGPPMPFSAPLLMGLEPTVTIGGKAVAVVGSQGMNTPPHVGLHPADPFMVPTTQQGTVMSGSPTVTAGGKPIATTSSQVTMCAQVPGQPISTVTDVTVA